MASEPVNVEELANSQVGGSLATEHQPGQNILWCNTFQVVWNKLMDTVGGPVALTGRPELAEQLNQPRGGEQDLDPASYVAMSGYGSEDIITKITAALDAKFGDEADPSLLPSSVAPDDWIAYALLLKSLTFEHPFAADAPAIAFNGKTPVEAFGLRETDGGWYERAQQVRVLSYASRDDFAVELATQDPDDRLIIARRAPGRTLEETIDAVLSAPAETYGSRITRDDTLAIPKVDFHVLRNYGELTGRSVENPFFTTFRISEAVQDIKFSLNEEGAKLKSEAVLGMECLSVGPPPREMVCDGPFMVMLMRKGAERPYFAAWIENPEVLIQKTVQPPQQQRRPSFDIDL